MDQLQQPLGGRAFVGADVIAYEVTDLGQEYKHYYKAIVDHDAQWERRFATVMMERDISAALHEMNIFHAKHVAPIARKLYEMQSSYAQRPMGPADDATEPQSIDMAMREQTMRIGHYKMTGALMEKYRSHERLVRYVYLPRAMLEDPDFTFDETFHALGMEKVPNVVFKFHGTFEPAKWNCRLPERPDRCPNGPVVKLRKQLFPFNGYPDRMKLSGRAMAADILWHQLETRYHSDLSWTWQRWREHTKWRKEWHPDCPPFATPPPEKRKTKELQIPTDRFTGQCSAFNCATCQDGRYKSYKEWQNRDVTAQLGVKEVEATLNTEAQSARKRVYHGNGAVGPQVAGGGGLLPPLNVDVEKAKGPAAVGMGGKPPIAPAPASKVASAVPEELKKKRETIDQLKYKDYTKHHLVRHCSAVIHHVVLPS